MVRPVIEEGLFKSLPYWQQWDELAKLVFDVGGKPTLPANLLHVLWTLLQMGFWYGVACRVAAPLTGVAFSFAFLRILLMGHFLTEFLSWTGMYSGPLMGQIKPPFPYTTMRFRRGTIKEPLCGCMWDKRNSVDVGLALSTVLVMLFLIFSPAAGKWDVLWPACVASWLILDFSCYAGAFGCWYGPVSVIYGVRAVSGAGGFLSAMQLVLVLTYVGSGIGKVGPWFATGFSIEWVLPAWFTGSRRLQRLLYKNVAGYDFSHTRLAYVLGYCAATVEWLFPLLWFLTPDVVSYLGVGSLGSGCVHLATVVVVSMHIYNIAHLPAIDVNMINCVPIVWLWTCFELGSVGFAYSDFRAMHSGIKLMFAFLFGLMVYGQRNPDEVSYLHCYRFWSGTIRWTWLLMTDSAVEKLSRRVLSTTEFPAKQALKKMGLMSPWECDFLDYFVAGVVWLQMPNQRVLPSLLHELTRGKPLHETNLLIGNLQLTPHCVGSCGNCDMRMKQLLPRLQRHVQFAEGECTTITIGAFPLFGSTARYEVQDMKTGTLFAGSWTTAEAMSLTKPSDGAQLTHRVPLVASV